MNATEDKRACEICGDPLVRNTLPCGQIEPPSRFAVRKFCNRVCAGAARSAPLLERRRERAARIEDRKARGFVYQARQAEVRKRVEAAEAVRALRVQCILEMAQIKSAGQIGDLLGISRNTVIGLADRSNIALRPPVRLTEQERLERRAGHERNQRMRLQKKSQPRVARTFVKPGRLVARMLWSGI